MNKFRFTINAIAVAAFVLAVASLAQAQATRTWVSGVGDDANPCSRTAPCKTFAGAISKTAKDGEIDCLDPGGFGTVTITKSITIDGTHGGGFGSILSAGASAGVIINITDVNDVRKTVRLVKLDINGASTGTDGVRINSANAVDIEDCVLDGFTNRGINDIRSISGKLIILDTTVRNLVQSGIVIIPISSATVTAVLDNVRSTNSTSNSGYAQSGGTGTINATLRNCVFDGNAGSGVFADGAGSLTVIGNNLSYNGTGITVTSPAIVRLIDSVVTNNTTSINAAGVGQVSSNGNNVITGNSANNLPTGPGIGGN